MYNSFDTGQYGEILARKYLERKGYLFIRSNYIYSNTEIDLIMQDQKTIVFIEVKTRLKTKEIVYPEDAISNNKIRRIMRIGEIYLYSYPIDINARIDAISIIITQQYKVLSIKHFTDIS